MEWNKLVQRSLTEDFKLGEDNLSDAEYDTRVHESYLLSFISILKTMDDETAANCHMLHLLDVICEKGFPDERQRPNMKIKIGCPRH